MLWIIGVIVIVLLIFTGGSLLGWLLQIIGLVFRILLSGWTYIVGCLVRLLVICFTLYIMYQVLLAL